MGPLANRPNLPTLKIISSRVAFARDLTSDESTMLPSRETFPLMAESWLVVVRSLRLRYAQRRGDMRWGGWSLVKS